MEKPKPWQIMLFLAAGAAIIYGGIQLVASSGGPPRRDSMVLIDVLSGDLYEFKMGPRRGLGIPARHPDSGDRTLFPVEEGDNGGWMLIGHYAGALSTVEFDPAVVDQNSLTVNASSDTIRKYEP